MPGELYQKDEEEEERRGGKKSGGRVGREGEETA